MALLQTVVFLSCKQEDLTYGMDDLVVILAAEIFFANRTLCSVVLKLSPQCALCRDDNVQGII